MDQGQYILEFTDPNWRIFGDQDYWRKDAYFYYRFDQTIFPIAPDETLIFVINDVVGRYYDSRIKPEICVLTNAQNYGGIILDSQLRCDGDNDGHFEYIIDFAPINIMSSYMHPFQKYNTSGEAIHMNHGTMELMITRTGSNNGNLNVLTGINTYVQVPFDRDTDGDGTTDYSDPDNDDDGVYDRNDMFPYNPREWMDKDLDGIGDNEDEDDNGNKIPDIFEIPIAIGIFLIPVMVILIMVRQMKKSFSENEDESKTIVYEVKYGKIPRRFRKVPRKYRTKKKYL